MSTDINASYFESTFVEFLARHSHGIGKIVYYYCYYLYYYFTSFFHLIEKNDK